MNVPLPSVGQKVDGYRINDKRTFWKCASVVKVGKKRVKVAVGAYSLWFDPSELIYQFRLPGVE